MQKSLKFNKLIKSSVFCLLFFMVSPAAPRLRACTLWGGAGEAVSGGGTMICKNRDWKPDQRQILERVTPRNGYRYMALRVAGPKGMSDKAAINEKGLVIVSATAGSIPSSERKKMVKNHHLIADLMASCATVEDVVRHSDRFKGPVMLMVSDRKTLAAIEIGPGGVFRVKKTADGTLFHTNHYLDPEMQAYNIRIGESSSVRCGRIQLLLSGKTGDYSLSDFKAFSRDKAAGPDDSIWRTGSTPSATRTLATWIVYQPIHGAGRLFVRIDNPGETEQVVDADFETIFSTGPAGGTQLNEHAEKNQGIQGGGKTDGGQ